MKFNAQVTEPQQIEKFFNSKLFTKETDRKPTAATDTQRFMSVGDFRRWQMNVVFN